MFHQLFPTFLSIALLVGLGYVLGKLHQVDLKSVAFLLIYGFVPVVVGGAVAQLAFTPTVFLLPFIGLAISFIVGTFSLLLGKRVIDDGRAVFLLPLATGTGNTGYFGLPVALAVLGNETVGMYMLTLIGIGFYDATFGYYYVARGNLTVRDALRRVARLPMIYAMIVGLILSGIHVGLPPVFLKFWEVSKGAYICIGMMLVGLALANQRHFKWDYQLIAVGLLGKFLIWPALALFLILMDRVFTNLLTPVMAQCLIVIACTPIAANTTAYAAQNDMPVQKAASLVMISTVLAIVALPFVLPILLSWVS
ncbi:MAG: AEC family transporter [Holosporaceae bacterium]|jgi:predicted permease|nr:AEC family transporter [Rhodospirillaceae bacterium]